MTGTAKEALDKIKEAELEADKLVEEAKKESRKILEKARLERERIIEEARQNVYRDSGKIRIATEEEALREAAEIKEGSRKAASSLKERTEANIDKALRFIESKMGI